MPCIPAPRRRRRARALVAARRRALAARRALRRREPWSHQQHPTTQPTHGARVATRRACLFLRG